MALPTTNQLNSVRVESFPIPPHDSREFTYIAAGAADDDDVATIKYYLGGKSTDTPAGILVATLTFTYFTTTNNVKTVQMTVP